MAISHCYCYSLYRQINWQIYPPSIKHRCLEYHYTKLGISTGRSPPINQAQMPWVLLHQTWQIYPCQSSTDALSTITPNLADLLADLTPINWAEMPWKPLHKIYWQISPINPAQMPWVLLHQTWQIYWQISPQSSIDALSTFTPNLADLPPIKHRYLEYCYTKLGRLYWQIYPPNWALIPWVPLHHTWQIYPLADLPPLIKHRCLENHYTKDGRSL